MNRNKIAIIFGSLLVLAASCADPDLAPVVTFDSAIKGAYVRLLDESGSKLFNLFDLAGSKYTYSCDFVDLERGALVSEYNLDISYTDGFADNGTITKSPVRLKSFSQSDFSTSAEGNVGIANVSITPADAMAALGLTMADLGPGDAFKVKGTLVLNDGSIHGQDNSTSALIGGAFRGQFDITFSVACPSSLDGSYPFETTASWCGETKSGNVTIVAKGGGVYTFSDWSFGAYQACYGGDALGWGALQFKDVCSEVSFSGFTDNYGETWTFNSTLEGDKWTITWENTYIDGSAPESGTAILTNPGGDWPFTLK
ncbi:MAG TPA: hypothetical protein P5275_17220 [Saprospiraceae bacterium]|nr:hypothetical protein [Saprospiraceae bacterium]MCB9270898.1 hypothetical protein [Lewinellaceae bacterium]HPG09444.1 hypothetical protein [Saprospiraceae bacterium]HPQ99755.1 hypothetical protein [Saprospiraceae bacterium]HQU53252.1 hypothetical protein [Saprospiraceae bacterium]